jgi:hypothetical protein
MTPLTNNNTKPLQTKPRNDKINRGEKSNGTKKEAEIQSGI